MPPPQKKFVKYTFDQGNNKSKDQRGPSRDNFKQRDNNAQNRTRRHVSYTQKPSSKQNLIKDMINSFIPINKPTPKIEQLMKSFPKFFNLVSKEPEPYNTDLLNGFLANMNKRPMQRQARTFVPIQPESESDPDWDSNDSDLQGGIESKKIDQNIIEKAIEKLGTVKQLRNDELKRHQKQFLQDYYRQKHQQQLQKQKNEQNNIKEGKNKSRQLIQGEDQDSKLQNQWTDYQQKQVQNFVNMGFIQKIQEDQNQFGDDDFSVEDENSESQKGEKSSESGDDDIFGDQGPTTIVKKKQAQQANDQKPTNLGTVVINSNLFSRIAEAVGIPPGACIWIIKNNKNLRYKVSTQFMDEMYRLNNFCESLPYVSLNHSQFVHNSDVQKQTGLQIFKKFNARKHQQNHHNGHHHHKSGNGNRNYDNNKRKFQQYKPNPNVIPKSHLNKK